VQSLRGLVRGDATTHTGRSIHFYEPGLEVIVEQHVVAVQLKAVLVIDHCALHRKQASNDDILHVLEQLVSSSSTMF